MSESSEIMLLGEAIERGIVKRWDFIAGYNLGTGRDKAPKISVPKALTGYDKEQNFKRQKMDWRLELIDGSMFLSANDVTETLILSGETGYYGGAMAQAMISSLYNDPVFANGTFSMTENLLQWCYTIPKNYWLGSPSVSADAYDARHCMRCVKGKECVGGRRLYIQGMPIDSDFGVRPLSSLKKNVKVRLYSGDGTEEYPWKLYAER